MDINPRTLRYFLVLAEEEHFRRASERLHVTSPALSQQIRQLESTLQVQLFERTSRSVRLTEPGRELVPLARAAVAAADEIAEWASTASRGRRVLRVGFMSTGAGTHTQDILRAAAVEMPEVEIELRYLEWGNQIEAVVSGAVDVAFVRDPEPPATLRSTPVFREPRVVLLPLSHPLANRSSVSFAEISDEVFLPSATGSRAWIDHWLVVPRPDGSQPKLGPSISTVEEMLEHCAARRGIALSSESLAQFYRHPGVRFARVDDLPMTPVLLCAPAESTDPSIISFERLVHRLALRSPGWLPHEKTRTAVNGDTPQ